MQRPFSQLQIRLRWVWPLTWRVCNLCGTAFRWQRGYRALFDSFIAVDIINIYRYYCRDCIDKNS